MYQDDDLWYFLNMDASESIPTFTLFGETSHFPDIVHCERFSDRAPSHDWHISAHRHTHMAQLLLVKSGRIDALVDGVPMTFSDNRFLFIPANKVHQFHIQPRTEGLVISVPLGVLNTVGPASNEIQIALSKVSLADASSELIVLSDMLDRAISCKSPFRAQRAVGLSHAILAILAESAMPPSDAANPKTAKRMTRLDSLISEHMADNWTAADYARALCISPGHLSRLCREATGDGVSAYIEQVLMEEACRLLAFTQLPVSDVGYRLGYSDPSYFSKRFRKSRHRSPSEYRLQFVN